MICRHDCASRSAFSKPRGILDVVRAIEYYFKHFLISYFQNRTLSLRIRWIQIPDRKLLVLPRSTWKSANFLKTTESQISFIAQHCSQFEETSLSTTHLVQLKSETTTSQAMKLSVELLAWVLEPALVCNIKCSCHSYSNAGRKTHCHDHSLKG